jgi:hypothetical protein
LPDRSGEGSIDNGPISTKETRGEMRPLKQYVTGRGKRGALAVIAVACLPLLGAAPASAAKINKADFLRFINCPIEQGGVCTLAETLKGEFKIGSKTVPITVPVVIQGGLAELGFGGEPLIPPRFGAEELSKSPEPLPGGLTGLTEGVGGSVTATAELAGTAFVRPLGLGFAEGRAVVLPFKVHLENELLGPNCYIGSNAEPLVLNLTDGTTEPPAGVEPISGAIGKNEGLDKGDILAFIGNKLVDNTFAAPAATGCGTSPLLEPIVTALVNVDAGLPSAPGKNTAILEGNVFTSFSADVAKFDKKALKAKEKELAGKRTKH